MYTPHVGRWLSKDPAEFIGGLNAYLYAGNAPATRVDPTGLKPILTEDVELNCPHFANSPDSCNCDEGICTFNATIRLAVGRTFCFSQTPGELPPNAAPATPSQCYSEIDRTSAKKDHFTLTLQDGTKCKFTREVFPPGAPWPPLPDALPAKCVAALDFNQAMGCYQFKKEVKAIDVDFTIGVSCGCTNDRSYGQLTLKGTVP